MNQINRFLAIIVMMALVGACANREPTGKEGEESDSTKKTHGGQYNPDVRQPDTAGMKPPK